MSHRYLGEEFDIHGGGIDLRFPHHENEQAQSHGAGWGFARHWVHNAWVTIKGEKMSKSLGNSLIVSELLKTYDPAVLRLALGTVHYRSTVEFSEESLTSAAALWERLSGAILRAWEVTGSPKSDGVAAPSETLRARPLPQEFTAALDDDLNLAGAMASIHATLKALNSALASSRTASGAGRGGKVGASEAGEASGVASEAGEASGAGAPSVSLPDAEPGSVLDLALSLRAQLDVLGLDPFAEPWRARFVTAGTAGEADAAVAALSHLVEAAIEERATARAEKDWARADALRDRLTQAGVVVEDSADGARWHLA